jgi:hypothetical protein
METLSINEVLQILSGFYSGKHGILFDMDKERIGEYIIELEGSKQCLALGGINTTESQLKLSNLICEALVYVDGLGATL